MSQQQEIQVLVKEAKTSMEKADALIYRYLPFIKSKTAKFLNRPAIEGQDEELSIAMIAFHEAIKRYDENKGAFLKYAEMLMRNRLIDNYRKNVKHDGVVSVDQAAYSDDEETSLKDTLSDGRNMEEEVVTRQATQEEIQELSRQMKAFGVSMTDVAEDAPKQKRTVEACQKAVRFVVDNPAIMERFLEVKKLPLKLMEKGTGVPRKTLERHRKYLIALLVIYSNGYEIIRGHISQVMKGETGK